MKEIKNRLVKVLSNYFNSNEVDISFSEIEKIAIEVQYARLAKCLDDEGVIYYLINISNKVDEFESVINKLVTDNRDIEKTEIKILFIVGTVGDKLKVSEPKYIKSFKVSLSKKLGLKGIIKTISDISVEFVSEYNKAFDITISNRVDRLLYDLKEEDKITAIGHVYVASLADLVDMYDKIGDSLFDLNVRYSIKDVLRVEKEIKTTLCDCPEKFWFFNNGITLIVERDSYKSDKPYSISLKNSETFSVINGAQTITTASKCFNENAEMMKKFREAKVLLRIIAVDEIKSTFAKDVSLSLNRQKSITQVDIATSFEFVKSLNDMMLECDNNDICFELSKRGGTPVYKYHYYIDEFAQIVEAYLNQKPGSARRNKNALIDIVADESKKAKLARDDIFKEVQNIADIKKYYTPVNYAYELAEIYKKRYKDYAEGDARSEIISYGRFYFIAAVIFCLNDKNTMDFSEFVYLKPEYNDMLADKFISCFFEFLKSKNVEALDSNDFKTEKLYEEFKMSVHMENLYKFITDIKSK